MEVPPKLDSIPAPPVIGKPRARYSPLRRALRVAVWVTLLLVIAARMLHPPPPREGRPGFGGGGGPWGGNGGFRRPATRIQPPVAKVPADLWRIQIEIGRKDADRLRGYVWNGWGRGGPRQVTDRPEVPATVREGDHVYTNVTVHLKGSAGSFRPFDDKPAMTLNFSKNAPGQKFHGFSKISLNNSLQDPSYITEKLCREIVLAAGVPVPAADHATVILNGRDLGLFVVTEGWGKPFLKRHFADASGNLYDGGFLHDLSDGPEVNSGDSPKDTSALDRLVAAAEERDRADRWRKLQETLDVDRFATLLALEVMMCHWDGYALNRNNYRVFHDRSIDRMVFMPHGLDQMFGGGRRMSPSSPIQPAMQGMLARAFMSMPEGRRLYLGKVGTLLTNVFIAERLTSRVDELAARLRPTLEAYSPESAREHAGEVSDLKSRIEERCTSIAQQLSAPKAPMLFTNGSVATVAGWAPRTTARNGSTLKFGRSKQDGRRVLQIEIGNGGGGSGSWRTRVTLDPGSYRFEAMAKTVGAAENPRVGVSIRASGTRVQPVRIRPGDWTPLDFAIHVGEPESGIELVCELTGQGGEVWFDEDSLKLIREDGESEPGPLPRP